MWFWGYGVMRIWGYGGIWVYGDMGIWGYGGIWGYEGIVEMGGLGCLKLGEPEIRGLGKRRHSDFHLVLQKFICLN